MNQAPVIIEPPDASTAIPAMLNSEDNYFFVICDDPDGDDMPQFLWTLDNEPPLASTESTNDELFVSTIVLPRQPAYDGRTLRVTILDRGSPPADARVSWLLEVPQ